jgi:hypothetical protein
VSSASFTEQKEEEAAAAAAAEDEEEATEEEEKGGRSFGCCYGRLIMMIWPRGSLTACSSTLLRLFSCSWTTNCLHPIGMI